MSSNYTVPILRVLYPKEFPATNVNCRVFPHLTVSRLCPYPGLFVEIITIIADYLNSTIIPHSYTEIREEGGFDIGKVTNGNASGRLSFHKSKNLNYRTDGRGLKRACRHDCLVRLKTYL
jgi:hypothetical protein